MNRPSSLFRALRLLAAEEPIELSVVGRCMEPERPEGTRVRVLRQRWYWPGDVVAFYSRRGELLLHRVIGYWPAGGGFHLLTQADAAERPDAPVRIGHIVGRELDRPSLGRRRMALRRFVRHLTRRWRAA